MTHDPQGPESPHDRLLPPPGGPLPLPPPPPAPPPQLEDGDAEKVKVLQRDLSPGCSPVFILSRHSDRKRSTTAAVFFLVFFSDVVLKCRAESRRAPHKPHDFPFRLSYLSAFAFVWGKSLQPGVRFDMQCSCCMVLVQR